MQLRGNARLCKGTGPAGGQRTPTPPVLVLARGLGFEFGGAEKHGCEHLWEASVYDLGYLGTCAGDSASPRAVYRHRRKPKRVSN